MNELSIFRGKIQALENALLQFPQAEQQLSHTYGRNTCVRQLAIPKGSVLTSRVHKFDQVNMLLKGKIAIYTNNGLFIAEAPTVYVSQAGAKRAMYALEDSIWACLLSTETTDPDELMEEVSVSTFEEFDKLLLGEV